MEQTREFTSSLRSHRIASGLTQAELAERAGVSRQLVAAVEAAQNAPAVDAALRLAGALGTTVEALFSPAPAGVVSALGRPLRPGKPLRVGRVGDQLVAAELADHGTAGAGWARFDGILEQGQLRLLPGAQPAGLVLAGCDPALGLVEAMLQGLGARSLMAVATATGGALRALKAGTIHAAVVHGPADGLPEPPVQVMRLHLARWQVGVAGGSKGGASGLDWLLSAGVEVVQRDPGAASQQAFQRAVERIGATAPAGPRAAGHIEAARMSALLGCAAVTTEAAARAFGLPFQPLEDHTVEVWVGAPWATHPGVDTFGEILRSAAFAERVAQFGGYELAGCGSRV